MKIASRTDCDACGATAKYRGQVTPGGLTGIV
jgi:hypothetical protein